METKAGDSGAFSRFDLNRVPSPAFVIDAVRIRRNVAILNDVKTRAGVKVLCALKAFSMWRIADLITGPLDGVCASGLWEARLASEHYKGEIATYCAGYKAKDLAEILSRSDHVIFNSTGQLDQFSSDIAAARQAGIPFDLGLRINPMHSEGDVERYDPCALFSRLGMPIDQLTTKITNDINGIHLHTLCEENFAPLERTWSAIEKKMNAVASDLSWINLGGGHHITRDDYERDALVDFLIDLKAQTNCEIYLEPGEAVALDAGILVGEILDTHWNGMDVAITDISATCHMPDVLEAPYRPAMLNEASDGKTVRLGGPSCLAGDVIGDYCFAEKPVPGTRFAFLDQAHYSMVKTTTFNGVPLPSIWLWDSETDALECVKEFSWTEFRDRLS